MTRNVGLAAAGVQRGDLPVKEYDIYCPLMGDQPGAKNYYRSSCALRVRSGGCGIKCARKMPKVVPAAVEPVKPVEVVEPVVVDKPAKKRDRVAPCANCERVMSLAARGLCGRCLDRLTKDGTLDDLYPSKKAGRRASDGRFVVDLFGEPDLVRRLELAAKRQGSTAQEEAILYITAYLDYLGVK